MNKITITVSVDGQEVSRDYARTEYNDWGQVIDDMLDTLEKSNEEKF